MTVTVAESGKQSKPRKNVIWAVAIDSWCRILAKSPKLAGFVWICVSAAGLGLFVFQHFRALIDSTQMGTNEHRWTQI